MRTNHVQDELAEGFEPAPLPVGPDGGLEVRHLPVIDPPPRLCEQGPCVHYHHFRIQMDAQTARAARLGEQGRLEGAPLPEPVHFEDHHYCYPDVGIETVLGDLPVLECNRWDPGRGEDGWEREQRQMEYLRTLAGETYTAKLAAWQARQDERVDAEAGRSAEDLAAQAEADAVLAEAALIRQQGSGEPTDEGEIP